MAYNRVEWENSPSTATPITANNLNIMDNGIYDLDNRVERLEPYVLYSKTAGGFPHNFKLNDIVENYEYIEVYCQTADGHCVTGKLYSPSGKTLTVTDVHISGSAPSMAAYIKSLSIAFSSNNATILEDSQIALGYNASTSSGSVISINKDEDDSDMDYYIYPLTILGYRTTAINIL